VARARQHQLDAVVASPIDGTSGLASQIEAAASVICVHSDPKVNYAFCELARTTYGASNVLANVSDRAEVEHFTRLGAMVVSPILDHPALLSLIARNPSVYALLTSTSDDKEVWEVTVQSTQCSGKPLREVSLPGDVLILAMRRNGDYVVPHGQTRLALGDLLTLIGSLEWVEPALAMLAADERGPGYLAPHSMPAEDSKLRLP
jgi:Trk K+ transport system NAD-binding subunit